MLLVHTHEIKKEGYMTLYNYVLVSSTSTSYRGKFLNSWSFGTSVGIIQLGTSQLGLNDRNKGLMSAFVVSRQVMNLVSYREQLSPEIVGKGIQRLVRKTVIVHEYANSGLANEFFRSVKWF